MWSNSLSTSIWCAIYQTSVIMTQYSYLNPTLIRTLEFFHNIGQFSVCTAFIDVESNKTFDFIARANGLNPQGGMLSLFLQHFYNLRRVMKLSRLQCNCVSQCCAQQATPEVQLLLFQLLISQYLRWWCAKTLVAAAAHNVSVLLPADCCWPL